MTDLATLSPDALRAHARTLARPKGGPHWLEVCAAVGHVEDEGLVVEWGYPSTRAWALDELDMDPGAYVQTAKAQSGTSARLRSGGSMTALPLPLHEAPPMPNRIIHEKATQSETLDHLADFTERTFWRLTTKADDYGRFDADPVVMLSRCYERRLNGKKAARAMEQARDEMAGAGLIVLYHHKERLYGAFVTWSVYQRDRGSKPKYPGPDDSDSRRVAASCGELPQVAALARAGVSRVGSRETIVGSRDNTSPPAGGGGDSPQWGQPADLIALYNRLAPPELGRVEKLSEARKRKAATYLRQFPEREFWTRTFSELRFSAFLRGLKPSPGHEHFRGDLDWLLTKGKDGTENAVKVAEGKFRDKERAR